MNEWLPVETLAETTLEIAGLSVPSSMETGKSPEGQPTQMPDREDENQEPVEDCLRTTELVYNTRSPHTLSWTNDFLPTLAAGGLRFERVSFSEWLEQLESRPSEASQRGNAGRSNYVENTNHNPAVKLL